MRHLEFLGEEREPSSFSVGYHSFIYLWTSRTTRAAPTLCLHLPPPSYGQKYGPREYAKPDYTVVPIEKLLVHHADYILTRILYTYQPLIL